MAFFINQKLVKNQMIPIVIDIPLVKQTKLFTPTHDLSKQTFMSMVAGHWKSTPIELAS